MPFSRPNLAALRSTARASFQARLPGADTTLRRSNIAISADTMAGLVNGEYGYIDYIIDQLFPDTATDYLARWLAIFNIPEGSATLAGGNAIFAGVDTTPIPAGTLVQKTDGSAQYATQAGAVISGGTATVAILALQASAGSVGNAPANAPLTLSVAIANINGAAAVDGAGLTGGVDQPTPEDLRAELLARIQAPPQGGNDNDYVQWALEAIPGAVTRAWVFPNNRGPGTVDVAFVMDGRSNIIPLSGDIATVQAYIDGKRPVTDDCVVFALTATPLNLTIHGLTPNNAATQAAIATAIEALLQRVAAPPNAALPGNLTSTGTVAFADIDDAIEGAAGVIYHLLTVPAGVDVTAAAGQIFVPGVNTYT